MAHFNLEDYETVEERIKRFYATYEDGRIITADRTSDNDRAQSVWRVKAYVYLSTGDQAADLPKATGHAFEVDGVGMANKTSALENAETSAIGRALANMGLSGNKRASREEMEKVQRGSTPVPVVEPPADLKDKLAAITGTDELDVLYRQAVEEGYWSNDVQKLFSARKKELS